MNRSKVSDIDIYSNPAPRIFLVDFDHTLLGGNSTELFVEHSHPVFLIRSISFLIRKCIPWSLMRLENSFRIRDYIFIRLVLRFFPRNLCQWQHLGPVIFEQCNNRELMRILQGVSPANLAIITFGMESIIRPMLRDSSLAKVRLLATPSDAGFGHFLTGKLGVARLAFERESLSETMFITDSEDDLDLLESVGYPVLIVPHDTLRKGAA